MTGIGINMGLGLLFSSNFVRPAYDPLTALPTLVAWFDASDPAKFVESGGTLVSVTNKKSSAVWRRPVMTGSPNLTFTNVGVSGDTIARDTGSWIADGFSVGDTVTITGAVNGANNVVNGAITAITATTITFGNTSPALTTEGPTAGCTAVGSLPMPGYSATGFNAKPGFTFAGAQGVISTEAAVVAALQGGTAHTVFVAGKVNTAAAAMALLGAGSNANATNANRYFGNNTGGSGVWIGACRSNAGSSINYSSTGAADTNPNVLEWYTDGSTASIQRNGAAADPNGAAAVTGASAPTRAGIGCRPASTPNVLLTGAVGEILVCSSLLTLSERNAVRAYLGAKWGIATT